MIIWKYTKIFIGCPYCKRLLILLIFLILTSTPVTVSAFDIVVGTGEAGTFSNFTGRMLDRIISRHIDNINCKIMPASGDMHNLTNLHDGALDIALIDSRMLYDAINKTGDFEFLDINYKDIQVLVPLNYVPISLIALNKTGITSLQNLHGRRINVGAPGSLQQIAFTRIMKAKNWSKKDFSLITEISDSQAQDKMIFCYGTVEAMLHIGVHPDSSLQDLFKLCKASLVTMNDSDIKQIINQNPAFSKIIIPANTYSLQTKPIATFGTQSILVTSKHLDKETACKIVGAIYSNKEYLQKVHPALSLIDVNAGSKSLNGVEFHSGTVKYFLFK